MKINLFFGFLGSGKTTLVRRVLAERAPKLPLAVIVNEFGQVGIDGAILEGRNVDIVELNSGCVCCTLKGSLLNAIEELQQTRGVKQVVVEATGIAQPEDMLETLSDPGFRASIDIGPLVTVVDAAKFHVLRENLGEFYGAQIANADVLLLNKIDLADSEQLESVHREVQQLNPEAAVLFTEQCEVNLAFILDGNESAIVGKATVHPAHHDHGHDHVAHPHIDSIVLATAGNSDRAAIEQFFATLPANVWRAKGFTTIDGQCSLVQYAAGQLEITAAPEPRKCQLVFIGAALDQQKLEHDFTKATRGGVSVGGLRR